jgi:hypothetical protein
MKTHPFWWFIEEHYSTLKPTIVLPKCRKKLKTLRRSSPSLKPLLKWQKATFSSRRRGTSRSWKRARRQYRGRKSRSTHWRTNTKVELTELPEFSMEEMEEDRRRNSNGWGVWSRYTGSYSLNQKKGSQNIFQRKQAKIFPEGRNSPPFKAALS